MCEPLTQHCKMLHAVHCSPILLSPICLFWQVLIRPLRVATQLASLISSPVLFSQLFAQFACVLCHCTYEVNQWMHVFPLDERWKNFHCTAAVSMGTWQLTHPWGYNCSRKECMSARALECRNFKQCVWHNLPPTRSTSLVIHS